MLSKSLVQFLKSENLDEYSWKIFVNLIPSQDTTLYVVNSHLIIEELIRDLIALRHTHPPQTFHQKSLLLKALYGSNFESWTYSSITALNALRNVCAHSLESLTLDKRLSDFILSGYDRSNDSEQQRLKEKGYFAGNDMPQEQLLLLINK